MGKHSHLGLPPIHLLIVFCYIANRTVSDAIAVHGKDPQHLVEKIIRERIYDSLYWKEHCFGLSCKLYIHMKARIIIDKWRIIAATLMDKAVKLTYIGGQYAGQHPTEFLCLTLKMLQLQPEKEIVHELIKQEDFKYVLGKKKIFYGPIY